MTAIMAAGIALIHIFLFIGCIAMYTIFHRKEGYGKREVKIFISAIVIVGVFGFFVANHFAFLSSDKSVLLVMGYTAIPLSQVGVLLLSYPITILLKEKYKLRYPSIILGILASAPFSYLLATTLSPFYWQLLGENIYG